MWKLESWIFLLVSVAVFVGQPLLWGQGGGKQKGEKGSSSQVRIIYGSAVGYPESPVELSFYLTAPDVVGSMESQLHFSKELLKFVSIRKSNILELADTVNLEFKVEDDPQEKSRSILKVSVRNFQGSKKPIPTGLLAFVTFEVSADVKPGDVKLDHQASVWEAGSEGKPLQEVVAESPVLSIYPKGINPLLTCFFFTH